MARVALARFGQRAPAGEVLPRKAGRASNTRRMAIAPSGKLPGGSFQSNHSSNIRTAPLRPCCSVENGLPNRVVRSTFTVLAGMRQPLLRRSWMRFGVTWRSTPADYFPTRRSAIAEDRPPSPVRYSGHGTEPILAPAPARRVE